MISPRNSDAAQQPLLPTMRPHGHSPVPVAADEWVERSVGHRKSFGKLVVDGQDAALPPDFAVSGYQR